MKNTKKLLVLLTMIIAIVTVTLVVASAENYVDSNQYFAWTYKNGTLTITDSSTPAEGPTQMSLPFNPKWNSSANDYPWYKYAPYIEEIVVDTDKCQGSTQPYYFAFLPSLKRVRLPETWVFTGMNFFYGQSVESVALGDDPYEPGVWDFSTTAKFYENRMFEACGKDMDITLKIGSKIWVGAVGATNEAGEITFNNFGMVHYAFFTNTTNITIEVPDDPAGPAPRMAEFAEFMAAKHAENPNGHFAKSVTIKYNVPTFTGIVDTNEYYIWELIGSTLTIKDNPKNTYAGEGPAGFEFPKATWWPYNPAQTWNSYAAKIEEIIVEPETIQGNLQTYTFAGLPNLKKIRLPESWVHAKSSMLTAQNVVSIAVGDDAYVEGLWDLSNIGLFQNTKDVAANALGLFHECCANMDITLKLSNTIWVGSETFGNLYGCTDSFFSNTTNLTIVVSADSTLAAVKGAFETKMAELYAAGAIVPKSVKFEIDYPAVTGVVDTNEYYIWELVGETLTIKDNPDKTYTGEAAKIQIPTADYWPYNPNPTWSKYASRISEIVVEPETIQGNLQNYTFAALPYLKLLRLPESWVHAKSSMLTGQNVVSIAVGDDAYVEGLWDLSNIGLFQKAADANEAENARSLFYNCCADMDITLKISDTIWVGNADFGNLQGCTTAFFSDTTTVTIKVSAESTLAAVKDTFEAKMAELYAAGVMVPKSVTIDVPVPADPAKVITMDGYSIRTEGYNGLRAQFTFDLAYLEELVAEGYTLVGYGGTAALADNEDAAVKRAAYTAEGGFTTILSKTDTEVKFAIAVVNIPETDLDTSLIIRGYAEFTKGGETVTVYTENAPISYNEVAQASIG